MSVTLPDPEVGCPWDRQFGVLGISWMEDVALLRKTMGRFFLKPRHGVV